VDPHRFDAVLDLDPTCHFDADPDPDPDPQHWLHVDTRKLKQRFFFYLYQSEGYQDNHPALRNRPGFVQRPGIVP
jgi:hypothetical protein